MAGADELVVDVTAFEEEEVVTAVVVAALEVDVEALAVVVATVPPFVRYALMAWS